MVKLCRNKKGKTTFQKLIKKITNSLKVPRGNYETVP